VRVTFRGIRGHGQGHIVVRRHMGLQGDMGIQTGPRADTERGGATNGAIGRVRMTSRGIRGYGQSQAVVERHTGTRGKYGSHGEAGSGCGGEAFEALGRGRLW